MVPYLNVMKRILAEGYYTPDRTGTGRVHVVGTSERFDLSEGRLPLVTTRKIFTRPAIEELLWFIRGSIDVRELQEKNVKFWDRWTVEEEHIESFIQEKREEWKTQYNFRENEIPTVREHLQSVYKGTIGPMYGKVWRDIPGNRPERNIDYKDISPEIIALLREEVPIEYEKYISGESTVFESLAKEAYLKHIDQFNDLLINLRDRPYSSRHVVTAWIPQWTPPETQSPQFNVLSGSGALAACHCMWQCFVKPPKTSEGKPRLSLLVYIRSNDIAIGAPTNIAQYAMLAHMLAHHLNYEADELIWQTGDAHLYSNHIRDAQEQVNRIPYGSPTLKLNPDVKSIYDFKLEDFEIIGYQHHDVISYELST